MMVLSITSQPHLKQLSICLREMFYQFLYGCRKVLFSQQALVFRKKNSKYLDYSSFLEAVLVGLVKAFDAMNHDFRQSLNLIYTFNCLVKTKQTNKQKIEKNKGRKGKWARLTLSFFTSTY